MGIIPINSLKNSTVSFSKRKKENAEQILPLLTPKQEENKSKTMALIITCLASSFGKLKEENKELTQENKELTQKAFNVVA